MAPSLALPLLLAAGCGQFVNAEDALTNPSNAGAVDLATRDALAQTTSLLHYGQQALLSLHTGTDSYAGDTMRIVEYGEIVASAEAQVTLADSLANLASVDPSLLDEGDERLAFWLNVYNLNVVAAVVAELQADPGWGGVSEGEFAMFETPLAQVGAHTFTLNQVEHGIIRGDDWSLENYFSDDDARETARRYHQELWGDRPLDARIHVGLNCASLSCPDILDGAFRASSLEQDLDRLATAFVDHAGKGAGPDGISQLFGWFRVDFEGSHGSVQAFVQQYRSGGDADVDYDTTLPYDWGLNGS